MKNYLINIDEIENSSSKRLQKTFEDFIAEIPSKTPIKAELEAVALGEFIQIKGKVEGTVLLECDLCLDEFEYDLDFEIDEMFAKNSLMEEYGEEVELKDDQFVTDLKGSKDIDIYDLLYQSVILDLPNKKVCGINCKRGDFLSEDDLGKNEIDPRLEIFKNIPIN